MSGAGVHSLAYSLSQTRHDDFRAQGYIPAAHDHAVDYTFMHASSYEYNTICACLKQASYGIDDTKNESDRGHAIVHGVHRPVHLHRQGPL